MSAERISTTRILGSCFFLSYFICCGKPVGMLLNGTCRMGKKIFLLQIPGPQNQWTNRVSKNENCHHLFTLMSFQTCMKNKNILKNVYMMKVNETLRHLSKYLLSTKERESWKGMKLNKWWQSFHFWVTNRFKAVRCSNKQPKVRLQMTQTTHNMTAEYQVNITTFSVRRGCL